MEARSGTRPYPGALQPEPRPHGNVFQATYLGHRKAPAKTAILFAAAAVLSLPALSACTTSTTQKDPTALRAGDIHVPTRKLDNLNDADLRTVRADLAQMDNCLCLTDVRGKTASRRYAVTWPSNAVVEREQLRGISNLEIL